MNLWPVVQRELRVQARRAVTWRLRWITGGLLVLSLGAFAASSSMQMSGQHGDALFSFLHGGVIVGILILCPLLTADTISQEKRRGTLSLLLLTPLTARDIVWGKGLAHALRAYLLWMAAVPVLLVPILAGGVSPEFALISLVVESCLIAGGLSSGLLGSSLSRRPTAAAFAGYGVFLLTAIPFLIAAGLAAGLLGSVAGIPAGLSLPVIALAGTFMTLRVHSRMAAFEVRRAAAAGESSGMPDIPWTPPAAPAPGPQAPAGSNPGTSRRAAPPTATASPAAVAFGGPAAETRRIGQPGSILPRPWARALQRWRRRQLDRQPLVWLLTRSPTGATSDSDAVLVLLVLAVAYAGFITLIAQADPQWIFIPLLFGMTVVSARALQEERRTGLIELISIAPLSEGAWLRGCALRLCWDFLPAILLTLAMTLYHGVVHGGMGISPLTVLALASLITLPAVGLGVSLRTRHGVLAFLGVAALAWIVPWLTSRFLGLAMGSWSHAPADSARAWSATDLMFLLTHLASAAGARFVALRTLRRHAWPATMAGD